MSRARFGTRALSTARNTCDTRDQVPHRTVVCKLSRSRVVHRVDNVYLRRCLFRGGLITVSWFITLVGVTYRSVVSVNV